MSLSVIHKYTLKVTPERIIVRPAGKWAKPDQGKPPAGVLSIDRESGNMKVIEPDPNGRTFLALLTF